MKKSNYNINITLDQARINGEVVSIANSELIRALFKHKNIVFSQEQLNNDLSLRKKLKKAENSEENRKKIEILTQKIEKTLFVEDLITIEFKHKSHYLQILKRKGFIVNGIRFTPFMASAGMVRRNTAMFINNNVKHPLMDRLENGRDEQAKLVLAKWGAYFSLYSSSSLPVSFPNFAVIPDKEIENIRRVDFVEYQGEDIDDNVTEIDYNMKSNAWDGQGLISPRLAKQWSEELELDYTLSCAIIRAPFMKGLVVTFDLTKFAKEVAGKYEFTDIYGIVRDIRFYDLIVSESMFKLFFAYKNTEDYIKNCVKNELGFSIAKVNLKEEKSYSRTSYQFLQVLDLNEKDVAELCEPTINWFRDISGGNYRDMLLFATGEHNFKPEDFSKMDVTVKALLLNPELSRDKYIQNKFIKMIDKKKKESYMANILINANYQFMVSDPYYQACHLFGIERQPLLKEGEHYSEYWLNKGIKTVSAVRSPIVHHSEFNVLNLQDSEEVLDWYSHIHSGIIFPANGVGMDCAIHGGADFDGDLICTINNPIMIRGQKKALPIIYESQKSDKEIVDSRDDSKHVEIQLNGHNSKVGFATNVSSSLYCLLEEFPKGSIEQQTILNRLKIGRVIQGEIIDGVKGLKIPPFRNHWTKYKKITDDMTPEEKEKWEFNNSILCEIRPAYFRFLYSYYMTDYNKEIKRYNIYSIINFGKTFDEISKETFKTTEEEELIKMYKRRTFFLDNNSVVNRISRYMRGKVGLVGKYSSKSAQDFDYTLLQNKNKEMNVYGVSKMKEYLQEYKSFKRGMRGDLKNSFENLDSFIAYIRKECFSTISSNESELANYAIEITYGDEISMVEFPWKLFSEGILENLFENSEGKVMMPVPDEQGDIEYLWNKYSMQEFSLEELYGN